MFELRPFQAEALAALEVPQHLLCIAPTGSGKSLIYERMAASRQFRMVLVTPLVALARQQHARLALLGIPVSLGSGARAQGPPAGESGAWIVSPESLEYSSRLRAFSRWKPDFMVVDECHCLWEWGDEFRPAFKKLPGILKDHEIERSLWLTATLSSRDRKEMKTLMPSPWKELGKFALPVGLRLEIRRVEHLWRSEILLENLAQFEGSGIIFVATRGGAERVSRLVSAMGKRVVVYHAGMSHEERKITEGRIQATDVDVIVATSAFGMGMDYGFLRWVILWQPPLSLLSLAQAIGRVGRGGAQNSRALVFWDVEDFRLLEWTASRSLRQRQDLIEVAEFLRRCSCRKKSLLEFFDNGSAEVNCGSCDFCVSSANDTYLPLV